MCRQVLPLSFFCCPLIYKRPTATLDPGAGQGVPCCVQRSLELDLVVYLDCDISLIEMDGLGLNPRPPIRGFIDAEEFAAPIIAFLTNSQNQSHLPGTSIQSPLPVAGDVLGIGRRH